MAARGDVEACGHGGDAVPSDAGTSAFPHCQYCAACPLAQQQHPATEVQLYPTLTPACQCQTDHWVAFAIVRYSGGVLRLLKRNDVHRALASFFSFLTVVFVLASRMLDVPACRYLLSTGIIANLYSLIQLSGKIWQVAARGSLHNASCYATFTCDLVLAYLLMSSSSVAVLGVNRDHPRSYYYDGDKGLARCSIAWSFVTFFITAMSSLLSGYKLYQRFILPYPADGTDKSTVEMAVPDDADGCEGDVANPTCAVGGAGGPANPAPTVGHVWGTPPSYAAALLQDPTAMLTPCQLATKYSSTALAILRYSNGVLHFAKQNRVRSSLVAIFSFFTFVFSSSVLDIAAFRYLFSTGIIAFAYSALLLAEGTWETAIKASLSLPAVPGNVCQYGTFSLDLVLSYLLASSSSVAVLGQDHMRSRSRTPACISIVWSFATFFFVAISSAFSGYKLCETTVRPLVSEEFDVANKSKP